MKRLLGQIGITYLSVLAVVFYFGQKCAVILAILSAILFVIFLAVKYTRKTIYLPVIACVALIACLANIIYTNCVYEKTVEMYSNTSGQAVVTLKEEPYKNYSTYIYRFNCSSIDGEECDFDFIASHDDLLNIEPFDCVKMEVSFDDRVNAECLSKKCFLRGNLGYELPEFEYVESKSHVYYYAIQLRRAIRSALSDTLSKDAFSLCSALLIGDKYALSNSIRQDFREAGVSHLVVVSGLHFSILAGGFFYLANKLRRYKYFFLSAGVLFILLYMSVTGYSPSVMRSGVMLFVYALGLSVSREPYSENSLGAAALVVTLLNPYSVGNVGLILSFASTFSIIKLSPGISRKFYYRNKNEENSLHNSPKIIRKAKKYVVDLLSMNISAYAVSVPLSVLFFDAVSTMSILTTFLLSFAIELLLIFSFVLSLLYFIPIVSLVLPIFSVIIELLTRFVLSIVCFVADLGFSYVHVTYDFVYVFIALSLLLFIFTLIIKFKEKTRVFAFSCVFMFLAGYLSALILSGTTSSLYVYDVENGSAVMYSDNDVNAVLSFDCNKANASDTISKIENTVSDIDFCSSVTDTTNSLNCFNKLNEAFAISDVLVYDTKRTVSLPDTVENVVAPSDVYTVTLSDHSTATYVKINGEYIIYLDTEKGSVLILDSVTNALDIPERYRYADTIVMRECPKSFEKLSCDTLIVSMSEEYAHSIMVLAYSISERVLLTADGDIRMIMEV